MTKAEIEQCIFDVTSWFARLAKDKGSNSNKATSTDLQRLAKATDGNVPNTLTILLQENVGNIYFGDKKLLSSEEIIELNSQLDRHKSWKSGFVAFAGDEGGALVVDNNGKVYDWDEEDGLDNLLSSNFTTYLENYRNQLLSGNFEFIDGVGAVETRSAHTSSSRK